MSTDGTPGVASIILFLFFLFLPQKIEKKIERDGSSSLPTCSQEKRGGATQRQQQHENLK